MASHFFFLRVSRVCSRSRATDNPPSPHRPSLPELTLPRLSPSNFLQIIRLPPAEHVLRAHFGLFVAEILSNGETIGPREPGEICRILSVVSRTIEALWTERLFELE